jgi:hypothetical protein
MALDPENAKGKKAMYKYLAVIFLSSAGLACAQSLSMSDKLALRENCKQDIQRLCPGVKAGNGGVMSCVKQNKDKLSEACSTTIAKLAAKRP